MLKNAHLKNQYSGYARTRFEPVKPHVDFPGMRQHHIYFWAAGKDKHGWLCLCQERYHWLLGQLVKLGVSIEHFGPDSKEIPESKCRDIASALEKLVGKQRGYWADDWMLKIDIRFWRCCGGVCIHNWGGPGHYG